VYRNREGGSTEEVGVQQQGKVQFVGGSSKAGLMSLEACPNAAEGRATRRLVGDVDDLMSFYEEHHDQDDTEEKHFDLVVMTQVLEHLMHPGRALAGVVASLAPGGRLVLTVPFVEGNHGYPFDFHRYTWQAVVRHVVEAGLCVEDLQVWGSHEETLLALLGLPPLGTFPGEAPPKYRPPTEFPDSSTSTTATASSSALEPVESVTRLYLGTGIVACKPPWCACADDSSEWFARGEHPLLRDVRHTGLGVQNGYALESGG
jgi:SAM-dependent methyltransferase